MYFKNKTKLKSAIRFGLHKYKVKNITQAQLSPNYGCKFALNVRHPTQHNPSIIYPVLACSCALFLTAPSLGPQGQLSYQL